MDTPIERCLLHAEASGMRAVPTRPGDGPIGRVRSVQSDVAHPASLSAVVGLGRVPLHTDGAFHPQPPDFVLMSAVRIGPGEDTLLWHPSDEDLHADLRQGVFAVSGRNPAFLAHAVDHDGRVRFDPVCMRPRDAMATRTTLFFAERSQSASRHSWLTAPEAVLLIDNRRTLHGRCEVAEGSVREVRRLVLRCIE